MRQAGSITMREIQRLVGEHVIEIESLRLYIQEVRALLPADVSPVHETPVEETHDG